MGKSQTLPKIITILCLYDGVGLEMATGILSKCKMLLPYQIV